MAKISIGLSESKILSSSMCAGRLLIFSEANLKPRLDGEVHEKRLDFQGRDYALN